VTETAEPSAATEKRRVTVSAGEFAFAEMGDPEDPAVLLLHGFGSTSHLWRGFAPMFAPWMHVVVPDLLGSGDSRPNDEAELGLVAQTVAVHELLGALGTARLAVVGHGFGGGIAQRLALEADVETLVLIDSIAFDAWPSETTREAQLRAPASGAAFAEAMVRTSFDLGMGHRPRLTEEDLEEYLRPVRDEEGSARFFRFLRALEGVGLSDRGEELGRLEIPVMILWGEDDPFLPVELAERLSDLFPRASAAVLPGCSHFLPEDAPDTVAPLVFQFLRSQYLGERHEHEAAGPVGIELGLHPPEGRSA
jgi:pimeloyl-ACP methyl ester carboxylesterase